MTKNDDIELEMQETVVEEPAVQEEVSMKEEAAGMKEQMNEGLKELQNMRPIDYALNMLTFNIMTGFFLGLPIAAVIQRVKSKKVKK